MTIHGFVSYSMERLYALWMLGKISRNDYQNRITYLATMRNQSGVLDLGSGQFHECGCTYHWHTIQNIIEKMYPRYSRALNAMYINEQVMRVDDITREEIENFLNTNFAVFGALEVNKIQEYM